MAAFYNEIDPYAAQWLRNLIAAGHIAPGVVDERSIVELDPDELRGFAQCHFFAGIGVWSHALRLAGIPDSRPLWTGSCPCQPFSAAGKGEGHEDERHLWPAWFRLIRECRPPVVFGEQVAGADGRAWLDVVCTDMEDDHYAIGAADLSAAGVGAPHIRQRLFFVAHAERGTAERHGFALGGAAGGSESPGAERQRVWADSRHGGDAGLMGDAEYARLEGYAGHGDGARGRALEARPVAAAGLPRSFWEPCDWIPCRDGKSRPVEPGTFPLAARHPSGVGLLRAGQEPDAPVSREDQGSRVGRLRAYGNSIVAPVAAEFIRAAENAGV